MGHIAAKGFVQLYQVLVIVFKFKRAVTVFDKMIPSIFIETVQSDLNGYLTLNVVVGGNPIRPFGKYGRMRKKRLQEYHPVLFEIMVMNGTLFHHLIETAETAQDRLEAMIPTLAKEAGTNEALKVTDQMKWVGIMNSCKAQAEEIIFHEIIYA